MKEFWYVLVFFVTGYKTSDYDGNSAQCPCGAEQKLEFQSTGNSFKLSTLPAGMVTPLRGASAGDGEKEGGKGRCDVAVEERSVSTLPFPLAGFLSHLHAQAQTALLTNMAQLFFSLQVSPLSPLKMWLWLTLPGVFLSEAAHASSSWPPPCVWSGGDGDKSTSLPAP